MSTDPWTLYWQGDNLESCVATQQFGESESIAHFWQRFAQTIVDNGKVIDLACGNGIVCSHLLQGNANLEIDGVDQAKIAPTDHLSDALNLNKVNFHPQTDICDLPFPDNSVDGITSQFGLEYAPLEWASDEAVRILRPQGRLCLLVHHAESEIVVPAQRQLQEISGLLQAGNLMDDLQRLINAEINIETLEKSGEQYLETAVLKTKQVSGQIFAGINQIIGLIGTNPAAAKELALSMRQRLTADQARLQQMSAAAKDEAAWQEFLSRFESLGISVECSDPFKIKDVDGEELLIAWQLSGIKS